MALDTVEKRRSVSGVALWLPGVTPNADQDAEWRLQTGWLYSGIAAAAPTGGVAYTLAPGAALTHTLAPGGAVGHAIAPGASITHTLEPE